VDTIAIVTVIATFITSLISLLTIIEMKKQRSESYKPIVVPVYSYYSLKSYSDGRYNIQTQDNSEYVQNLFIYLANAGAGTAINIRIKWSFELKKFANVQNNREAFLTIKDNIFSVVGEKYQCSHNLNLQTEEIFEYLLTAENKTNKIILPQYMTTIMKIIADNNVHGNAIEMPELKMKIEYEDIGLKKHIKEYNITFDEKYMMPILIEPLLEYNEIGRFKISKKK